MHDTYIICIFDVQKKEDMKLIVEKPKIMKTMKIIRIAVAAFFVALILVTVASLVYGIITGGADTNLLN